MAIRDKLGRFIQGERNSIKTEFKKGQHWRKKKNYWDEEWLRAEYVFNKKSASQIANEQGCTEANIYHFLRKHKIKIRSMSEIRLEKYWGNSGESNPMYGKTKDKNPNWKGGISSIRQSLYSSSEWKKVAKFVRKRDKNKCQRCSVKNTMTKKLHIHHIVSFSNTKLRCESSNLILLCKDCHSWVHSSKNINNEFVKAIANE